MVKDLHVHFRFDFNFRKNSLFTTESWASAYHATRRFGNVLRSSFVFWWWREDVTNWYLRSWASELALELFTGPQAYLSITDHICCEYIVIRCSYMNRVELGCEFHHSEAFMESEKTSERIGELDPPGNIPGSISLPVFEEWICGWSSQSGKEEWGIGNNVGLGEWRNKVALVDFLPDTVRRGAPPIG